MSSKDVVEDFCSSLCDLTVNSKPHINMLTMLAEDYSEHAAAIVQAVEDQLKQVSGDVKLPVLYLIDSIVKNVGDNYITLFSKNIVATFTHAFERVDEKARLQMYKLRQTWDSVFPPGKLYVLDTKVNAVDPAWPITAAPATSSIHFNPKFLNSSSSPSSPLNSAAPSVPADGNQQELLKQKKELLELQKRKVELELMQTKAILEEQTKRVVPKETKKIPPAATIILKKSAVVDPPPKAAQASRIRDPRLRFKDAASKDGAVSPTPALPAELKTSPQRTVLSPVPSPSNRSRPPELSSKKKDRKTKRSKESRLNRNGEKVDKTSKLTRAEEVLKNLEEEQRLSKIQKLVSDTVINKAKMHEKMQQDGEEEIDVSPPSPPIIGQLPVSTTVELEVSAVVKSNKAAKETTTTTTTTTPVKRKSGKRKRDSSPSRRSKKSLTPVETAAPLLPDAAEVLLDTDLRLLTTKTLDLDSSPAKKAKTEILDDLFGKEDVDLRALPPPPPIISLPTVSRSPERQKNWANLKRSNTDVSPEPAKRPHRPNLDRSRFANDKEDEAEGSEPSFDDPAFEEQAKERAEMIMKHAEEQLSNGNITFAQYNSLLKEVITMNEKRKLEEAMRLEDVSHVIDCSEDELGVAKESVPLAMVEPPTMFNKRRKHVGAAEDDTPPAPPPPDLTDRDFLPPTRRYRERSRFDGAAPWVGNNGGPPRGSRTRDKFGRWMDGRYDNPKIPAGAYRFGETPFPVNMPSFGGGALPHREVPPADPEVLERIANDPMKTINIDGVPREIRFYGETAVIMMAWDVPRELNFQPGSRRVTFNDRETVVLHFNVPYREVCVDGRFCQVRLGAPTRELFVDGVFYEGIFGGPPLQVRTGGSTVNAVRLCGPLPNVRIGTEPRTDLVAGKVTLIVDANDIFPIYLDAKPQRFDIGGVPYILRFVEALQTVVINGVPFKIEFGSNLPVPMFFHGEKHYLRFSALPKGVTPGYVNIVNMEGGRLGSPPPTLLPPPMIVSNEPVVPVEERRPLNESGRPQAEQSLELLASLMPTVFTPGIGQSYTVEENSNQQPESVEPALPSTATAPNNDLSSINVSELLKKLVAVGIVPAADKKVKKDEKKEERTTEIVPVSFDRTDGLKTRQPGLVHLLYSGMQCSSCGVRFPPEQTGKYSQHLDWHFRQNRRERDAMRVAQSRRWNYDVSDWIQYQEIEEKEDRAQSWFEMQEKRTGEAEEAGEDEQSVPAGEKGENVCCAICQDKFDQFYNEEKEEWHLRRAIEVEDVLYHPLCYKEREERLAEAEKGGDDNNEDDVAAPVDMLGPPVDEPETIEIPDDAVPGDASKEEADNPEPDNKMETIDLIDSEQSNSKDGAEAAVEATTEEVVVAEGETETEQEVNVDEGKLEEAAEDDSADESDDDILQIEVLENKIETFELSDEEDKTEGPDGGDNEDQVDDQEPVEAPNSPTNDDDLVLVNGDFDLSRVKSEKVEVVDLDTLKTQPLVVSSIDGNVELEDATPVSLPKRIKINISSAITKSMCRPAASSLDPPRGGSDPPPPDESAPSPALHTEPPPPGEELYPQRLKTRIADADLAVLSPVAKGSELSALCSIM